MPNNRFTMSLSNIISIKNVYTDLKILYANSPHNVSYKKLISYEDFCWFYIKLKYLHRFLLISESNHCVISLYIYNYCCFGSVHFS